MIQRRHAVYVTCDMIDADRTAAGPVPAGARAGAPCGKIERGEAGGRVRLRARKGAWCSLVRLAVENSAYRGRGERLTSIIYSSAGVTSKSGLVDVLRTSAYSPARRGHLPGELP